MKRNTGSEADMDRRRSITEGRLLPALVFFMLPLILSGLLQQSYTIADGLILGNAISQEALGAVSSVGAILDVCILVQIAISNGCSIVVSHLYGGGRSSEIIHLVRDIRRIIIIISAAVAAAAFIFSGSILRLIHTPQALIGGADTYMKITFIGVPFMALYTLQAGILRGMGDSKRPLGGIAVSTCVNIGLDLVFVVLLGKGIAGAAIATVTAEALSALYLYIKVEEKCRALEAKPDTGGCASTGSEKSGCPEVSSDKARYKENVKESVRLGTPQIAQSVFSSCGNVLLQNITNIMGDAVVIGVAAAFKADSVLLIPMLSISTAVSVFTGQNIGAAKPDRVRDTLKYGFIIIMAFAAVMSLVLWKLGYPIISLFGLTGDAADAGFRYILVCLPFYWLFGLQFLLTGYLNGAKHTAVTAGASAAGLAGRVALAYLGYGKLGADALPLAEALSWLIVVGISIAAIFMIHRTASRTENTEQDTDSKL